MRAKISRIKIGNRLRDFRPSTAKEIATSFEEIGQRHPITVKQLLGWGKREHDYELVSGLHRLRSAQMLGWSDIWAVVVDGDKAQKVEIHENTQRADLTALERAEHLIAECRQIEAELAAKGKVPRPGDIVSALPIGGNPDAKKKRVQRARPVAELPDVVKQAAKARKLDDNGRALRQIARQPNKRLQLQMVGKLSRSRKAATKHPAPRSQKSKDAPLSKADKISSQSILYAWRGTAARKKFDKATPGARGEFVRQLLRLPPAPTNEND